MSVNSPYSARANGSSAYHRVYFKEPQARDLASRSLWGGIVTITTQAKSHTCTNAQGLLGPSGRHWPLSSRSPQRRRAIRAQVQNCARMLRVPGWAAHNQGFGFWQPSLLARPCGSILASAATTHVLTSQVR